MNHEDKEKKLEILMRLFKDNHITLCEMALLNTVETVFETHENHTITMERYYPNTTVTYPTIH